MQALNLPPFAHKITEVAGKAYIFDSLRRKYVRLSPEEWVRQHLIHLLIGHYQYPKALIRTEGGLTLNQTRKRTDILVYTRAGEPFLLVECKAPDIPLTQRVFDQLARYNHIHRAPYVVVSNGLTHFCCQLDHSSGRITYLDDFPTYSLA